MIIEHDGVTQSVNEWALDYGIPADLIAARIDAGWTKAAAIEAPMENPPGFRLSDLAKPERKRTGRRHPHDGKSLTVVEWAQHAGLPSEIVRGRVNQGWSIERAITTPFVRSQRAHLHTFDGKSLSLAEWASLSGVSVVTLKGRLRNGWSIARALTERTQLTGKGPRKRGGGYLPTSADRLGTGGGSSAQDSV